MGDLARKVPGKSEKVTIDFSVRMWEIQREKSVKNETVTALTGEGHAEEAVDCDVARAAAAYGAVAVRQAHDDVLTQENNIIEKAVLDATLL